MASLRRQRVSANEFPGLVGSGEFYPLAACEAAADDIGFGPTRVIRPRDRAPAAFQLGAHFCRQIGEGAGVETNGCLVGMPPIVAPKLRGGSDVGAKQPA
jgi:hypothetical protein